MNIITLIVINAILIFAIFYVATIKIDDLGRTLFDDYAGQIIGAVIIIPIVLLLIFS